MKYMCSCGKVYDNLADAEKCENKHEEEKAKREKLKEERQERAKEIKKLYLELKEKVDKFNEDYPSEPYTFPFAISAKNLIDYLMR